MSILDVMTKQPHEQMYHSILKAAESFHDKKTASEIARKAVEDFHNNFNGNRKIYIRKLNSEEIKARNKDIKKAKNIKVVAKKYKITESYARKIKSG